MMTRVCRLIFVASVLVAARTYAASPEFGAPFDLGPARGQAAAFDGTNYLVTWYSAGEIRAARVSRTGLVLDPAGIRVAGNVDAGPFDSPPLTVAFTNGVYLVAWLEFRDGPPTLPETAERSHFFFVRVDPQGTVLDPSPGLVTTMEFCLIGACEFSSSLTGIAVGADGTNFLLSGSAYLKHVAAVIAPTGQVLAVHENTVVPGTADALVLGAHSIAFDGTQYGVFASGGGRSDAGFALRLTGAGVALPPVTPLGRSYPYSTSPTSAASSGRSVFGTWIDAGPLGRAVYGGRLSGEGILLDQTQLSPPSGNPQVLATVFDGCQYVTAWDDRALRIAEDGSLVDAAPWPLPGPVSAMASDGEGTVLALSYRTAQLVRTCPTFAAAPLFDPPPSPVAEATSAAGAVVTFAVTARNEHGPADVVCTPASGSWFALGTTPVLCVATDPADPALSSSASFDVVVRDTTPPSLGLPPGITTPAVGPQGATVAFTVAAADLVDAAPVVTCSPAPGSLFPIGVTAVSCTARDAAGNVSPAGTFTVRVQGAEEQLAALIALVDGYGLPRGVEHTLIATLRLAAAHAGTCKPACTFMSAFALETRIGRLVGSLSAAQARDLSAAAGRIRAVLGCTTGGTCAAPPAG